MAAWQKISSKVIYQCPYFAIREDKVVRPDGSQGIYYVIDEPGAAAVVALDDQSRIYLLQEEKYIPGTIWTIPAGKMDKEEKDFLPAAKRELKEETGLTAQKWTSLGEFLIAPGLSTGRGHAFLAQGLSEGKQELDPSEKIKVVKVPLQQALEMIKEGKIIDAWAVLPILKAHLLLNNPMSKLI